MACDPYFTSEKNCRWCGDYTLRNWVIAAITTRVEIDSVSVMVITCTTNSITRGGGGAYHQSEIVSACECHRAWPMLLAVSSVSPPRHKSP